jgi:LuxR family maltose regulon positive regulatory protein
MNNSTLLTTKLYLPPPLPQVLARPRLLERLEDGRKVTLTLLSGPPGYGKTTLLSVWATDHPGEVAWLSLEEGDNDVVRFLHYLMAAIQTIAQEIGQGTTVSLERGRQPPPETFLAPVLNQLAASDNDLSLVLDDYHVIEVEPVHSAVTYLLDRAPPNLHLILATRADPPLPLSRLRGRGQLVELRAADLAFKAQEAAEFLQNVVDLELPAQDIATLMSRTEGWPAGLRMAAISLKDHDDPAGFVRMFGADDRHVVDYMVDEVLTRQPEDVRRFLLDTSILERLTGPLCEAVLGEGEIQGQTMIKNLEAANLFLLPLDDKRIWYRYHRLFADLLRERLRGMDSERPALLHRRASAWYIQQGELSGSSVIISDAVHHALLGGDLASAAELIEAEAESTLMRGELETFLRWVERLPESVLSDRPRLRVLQSLVGLICSRPLEEVNYHLDRAIQVDPQGVYAGEVATVRAMQATLRGDGKATAQLSEEALSSLPEESQFLRTLLIDNLGIAYLMMGNFPAAIEALEQAARMGERTGNILAAAGAWGNIAGLHFSAGHLHQAVEIFERVLDQTTDSTGQRLPAAGKALLGLGQVYREWSDFETAKRLTHEAITCFEQLGDMGTIIGYLTLATIHLESGDIHVARQYLEEAEHLAIASDSTELDDRLVHALWAHMALAEGDTGAAQHWIENVRSRTIDESFYHLHELEQTTLARMLLGTGQPEDALELLVRIQHGAETMGMSKRLAEILVLQSLAFEAVGDQDQALAALESALHIGEPEGFVRTFVVEGEPMGRLLHEAARRGITSEYVGRLLAAFPHAEPEPVLPGDMVEPLSERELEVLVLLAEGNTNAEIAQELHLALSTVKWHASNIYGKLGVKNRSQAVARARSLGLLNGN